MIVELTKQLRRRRTYVALAAVMLLPIVMAIAYWASPPGPNGAGDGSGAANDPFALPTASALNFSFAALYAMSHFLLVIVVALFAGSAVAEESSWGSLRYLLVRPVPRPRLLGAKLGVAAGLAVAATVLIPVAALSSGLVAFGWHALATPVSNIGPVAAFGRFTIACGYVVWNMAWVIAVAFMFSTMVDSPTGAIAATVGIAVVSQILDAITALGTLRRVLPTHAWDNWTALLAAPAGAGLLRGFLLQLPWVVGPLLIALWWFRRRDVLT